MKNLNFVFIISILVLFFNSKTSKLYLASNPKTGRDPFQFQQYLAPTGPRYSIVGYGKSGDGTRFVIVNTGMKTETITEDDPNWSLYS